MELGPHGVRVVGIETGGVPETMPAPVREFMEPGLANLSMLKSAETLRDVADAAVFLCSDRARHITGTKLNITGGNTAD
jgi:NAD(P)-dependent dehydrogenase (short-subunit alcohol dehydrogenase family)